MRPSSKRCIVALAVALAVILPVTLVTPAFAGTAATNPGSVPPDVQYPQADLELLRARFLELVDAVQEASDLTRPGDATTAERVGQARSYFEQMSFRELNAFRAALDPAAMNKGLAEARATIAEIKPQIESFRGSRSGAGVLSAGLPVRLGPDGVCDALVGSGRPTAAAIIALNAVYLVAGGVRAAASRACNQVAVLVALGEGGGGNTSLACVAVDVTFYLAQAVKDQFTACDNDFTKRTIDANYDRLGHIHTDLDNSVANDNTNETLIVNNDNANKDTIVANDNSNKTAIIGNDNSNKTAIIGNDNSNKTSIMNNDNSNTTSIMNNDNANRTAVITVANANTASIVLAIATAKTELKDLILRTQIEAALATEDEDPVVAYETPASAGGYLELVRSIVSSAMANTLASGGKIGNAQSFFNKGDTFKAAGQFKDAYEQYRKAYQEAAKK